MKVLTNIKGELVGKGEETKKLGEAGADRKGEEKIPDKEFVNGRFGDFAFFPGDFGMEEVC